MTAPFDGYERYMAAANYGPGTNCPKCGKPWHGPIPESLKRKSYAGIDDAGDDMEDWAWNFINGRCVVSRRLKDSEIQHKDPQP